MRIIDREAREHSPGSSLGVSVAETLGQATLSIFKNGAKKKEATGLVKERIGVRSQADFGME